MSTNGQVPTGPVVFELQPVHVARAIFVLCVIPVLYKFSVEGVTTTIDYRFSDGKVTTTDNLFSQLVSVLPWIVCGVIAAVSERILVVRSAQWPEPIHEVLVRYRMASPRTDS
ncbi:hypothetical protein [Nocardia sp. NBC_00511]|uniref:hypothetical protein n=1 Tax=Nocardia sp. NBC_00511 TaxID=2903591 RepID=UPI0030E3E7AE